MAATEYTCYVNRVGPYTGGSQTPDPQIYICLTSVDGQFNAGSWFFLTQTAKREMLATALAAMTNQMQIIAYMDLTTLTNLVKPEIHHMYLVGS